MRLYSHDFFTYYNDCKAPWNNLFTDFIGLYLPFVYYYYYYCYDISDIQQSGLVHNLLSVIIYSSNAFF